jgi:hypothetical protein
VLQRINVRNGVELTCVIDQRQSKQNTFVRAYIVILTCLYVNCPLATSEFSFSSGYMLMEILILSDLIESLARRYFNDDREGIII